MGYVEEDVYITLEFSGKRKGLWIRVREPNTEEWEMDILPLLHFKDEPHKFTDIFCKLLHSWNLENEDGSPVPLTRAGFRSKNIRFTGIVLRAWINNAIVVPDDNEPSESAPTETVDPFSDMKIDTVELPPLITMSVG